MKYSIVLACCALTLGGCWDSTQLNPAPTATPSDAAAPEAAPDVLVPLDAPSESKDSGSSLDAPVVVKRTVLQRDPYGNSENLLLDGDMEWSAGAAQTPWRAIGSSGQVAIQVSTGGLCRSGLRCLVLGQTVEAIFGIGLGAEGKALDFSVYAKVSRGSCDVLTAVLFPGMTLDSSQQVLAEATTGESQDGWCKYEARVPAWNESVGIYFEANLMLGATVVLDEAVLVPAADPSTRTLTARLPSPRVQASLRQHMNLLNRHRRLGGRTDLATLDR